MTQAEPSSTSTATAPEECGETRDFRVIAILAAYNEADIIEQTVAHLIREGVLVYFLDHGSTDDTVSAVQPWLGNGLLNIERFPASDQAAGADTFAWQQILERKEELARQLDAHWFIHQDADEFRDSPWPDRNLRDAIRLVDRLGYNAIDFELLNFQPTHDDYRPGDDVAAAFRYYQKAQEYDRRQVRCWKKTDATVDLASTGGHDASFDGRRVFPLRFVLRHYPIRGQAHGERKVFHERRARFAADERARHWHVQYDEVTEGHQFLHDPTTLIQYDPDALRVELALRHRAVEALEEKLQRMVVELGDKPAEIARLSRDLDAREREADWIRQLLAATQRDNDERRQSLDRLQADHAILGEQFDDQTVALASTAARVEALLASASWRVTRPLRAIRDLLDRPLQYFSFVRRKR